MLWEVAKAKKNSGVEMQLEVLIREKKEVRESAHFCKEVVLVSIDVSGTLVMWAALW